MLLSSVPGTVFGALFLAARGTSLPHVSNDDQSGVLRIPMDVVAIGPITPETATPDIAKRTLKGDMNDAFYRFNLMMKLKASPGDQEINLAVDTGSFSTWTNPNCDTAGDFADFCRTLSVYKEQGEPLTQGVRARYGIGEATLSIFPVDLKLDGLEVDKFPLGVATTTKSLATGILGLSPPPPGKEQYSLVHHLAMKNYIKIRAFSIDVGHNVNPDATAGGARGSVIFGGIDSQKFSGNLQTVELLPYDNELRKYRVKIDKLSITMRDFPISVKEREITLDTGASHHLFPENMIKTLEDRYAAKNRDGILWVPCVYKKQGGDMRFNFGGVEIVTPLSELVADPMKADDKYCHTRIAQSNKRRILLGLPFFKSAYTVFDQDNSKFHVAKAANCGSTLEPITEEFNKVPLQGKC